ncbi:MAG: stringent starvation protein B [Gammaproteobacteria bacterium]|jgi:stringent starvation protein B
MTSSKPYLIRALYEWLLENDTTPYLLVDANFYGVMIPQGTANDGKVVLNLKPSAIESLEFDNEYIAFSARFGGVAQNVYCPMTSILAIYAQENGEGMAFNEEPRPDPDPDTTKAIGKLTGVKQGAKTVEPKKINRPSLKVVK